MQVGEEGQGNYGQTITLKRKEKKKKKTEVCVGRCHSTQRNK